MGREKATASTARERARIIGESPSLIDRLKSVRCKGCKVVGKLLAGPAYDRNKVRCLNCQRETRVKGTWR